MLVLKYGQLIDGTTILSANLKLYCSSVARILKPSQVYILLGKYPKFLLAHVGVMMVRPGLKITPKMRVKGYSRNTARH